MRKLLCIVIVLCGTSVWAQDPHFSQFFASPMTLNPAFTGKFDGLVRVAGNHRNQLPAFGNTYVTSTAAVDFPILASSVANNDRWGIGVMGFIDNAGNGLLKSTYLSLSTAYHKGLDEDGMHQLSLGFQATYTSKAMDVAQLKFEDQLTPLGFTGVTSEIFNNASLSINYFDFNAGILYNGSSTDNNNFYFGASMYHINRPTESFRGANFNINSRITLHGGGYFPIGNNNTLLHVSALHQIQGGANETVFGGALGFTVNEDVESPTTFYAGSWVRWDDSIIPYLGLEFGSFRLGTTYDFITSRLTTAAEARGGFEISLVYIQRPAGTKGINCPKF
jgi:type IX secretion system PorP/SprF family membrane protein